MTSLDLTNVDPAGVMVVLDTNVLRSTRLLRDPKSALLLAQLRIHDGTLGLPAVVRTEWKQQFLDDCVTKARQASALIDGLAEFLEGVTVAGLSDVAERAERAFDRRLGDLVDSIDLLPIEVEHWRTAGEMVIVKEPPTSESSQQYKDSLIWLAALSAARGGHVVLVTRDKGFLDKSTGELATNLQQQAIDASATIWITNDLTSLLDHLDPGGRIVADAASEYVKLTKIDYTDLLGDLIRGDWPIDPDRDPSWNIKAFGTDQPEELVLLIEATHHLLHRYGPELEVAVWADSRGSAIINTATGPRPEKLEFDEIRIHVHGTHGETEQIFTVTTEPPFIRDRPRVYQIPL